MKQRIYNGHSLEFYNEDNSKKGELRISGSDIVINPMDSDGTVIFGEEGSINDIEVGASGTAVDFTFVGGGAITSNGGTLTVGKTGDTVDLSNATIGTITASIFKGGVFLGDGSGLTSVPSTFTNITASANISASGDLTGDEVNINQYINHIGDADTYFGFSANNQVLFHVGGGDRLLINSSGNVGLGTTSPSEKLTVAGDISASGDIHTQDKFVVRGSGGLLRIENPGWTTAGNHDILYNGWTSDVDDYIYLKAGGNSTSNHGIIAISDNGGFFVGNTNTETGASTAAPPFDRLDFRVDRDGNVTASGNMSASGTVTANSLVGTLSTAAQTNITSLGQLTALNINGNLLFENNKELRWKDSGGSERTILELTNANDLYLGGSYAGSLIFVGGGSYAEVAKFDDSGHFVQASGKNLTTNHITASGNISSSATTVSYTHLTLPTKRIV